MVEKRSSHGINIRALGPLVLSFFKWLGLKKVLKHLVRETLVKNKSINKSMLETGAKCPQVAFRVLVSDVNRGQI